MFICSFNYLEIQLQMCKFFYSFDKLISEYSEKDVDTYIKFEFPFPTVSMTYLSMHVYHYV